MLSIKTFAQFTVDQKSYSFHYQPEAGLFGDTIPFYWDGVHHIFYMNGKVDGLIGSWGHIVSIDLVHWYELPEAISPGLPESIDGINCMTGSIFFHEGIFHMFYTGFGNHGQTICLATSTDLICWDKDIRNPILVVDLTWYAPDDWRDPLVMRSPDDSEFWMLIGAREKRTDDIYPYNACVALAVSQDLIHWEVKPPFIKSGVMYMDCPDLFPLGNRWCLLIALRETAVRIADTPYGPWQKMKRESADCIWAAAGKTLFDGNRRLIFPWLSGREGNTDYGNKHWGGRMLIARELILDLVGSPVVKCPTEVIAIFSEEHLDVPNSLGFESDSHDWKMSRNYAEVDAMNEGAVAIIRNCPDDYLFAGSVTLSTESTTAAIFIRTSRLYHTEVDLGYQIVFEPDRSRISLRPLSLYDFDDVMSEIMYDFTPDQPVSFQLIVHGPVIELFCDEKYVLSANIYQYPQGGIALMARDGYVRFSQLSIRTMKEVNK